MKKKINNSFFEFILFGVSFILGFFRSIFLFFGIRKRKIKDNIFFDFLNFVFRLWPKYFWQRPTMYKLFSFPGDMLNYLFSNKK